MNKSNLSLSRNDKLDYIRYLKNKNSFLKGIFTNILQITFKQCKTNKLTTGI